MQTDSSEKNVWCVISSAKPKSSFLCTSTRALKLRERLFPTWLIYNIRHNIFFPRRYIGRAPLACVRGKKEKLKLYNTNTGLITKSIHFISPSRASGATEGWGINQKEAKEKIRRELFFAAAATHNRKKRRKYKKNNTQVFPLKVWMEKQSILFTTNSFFSLMGPQQQRARELFRCSIK